MAGQKGQGDMVNIEVEAQTQAIVDTVERVLQVRSLVHRSFLVLLSLQRRSSTHVRCRRAAVFVCRRC